MKQIFLTFYLLVLALTVHPQTYKYGKITKEQWEIEVCNFDSISKSIIFFDIGNISIKAKAVENNHDADCKLRLDFFTLNYERNLRFKILKTDGIRNDFMSFSLRSINGKKDKLSNFKGTAFIKENGKEIKRKLGLADLIKEKKDDGSILFTLALNGINEGSIIDINYNIETNIFDETPEWNFSSIYPTLYSEINLSIPDFFIVQKNCGIINTLSYKSFSQNLTYGVSYALTQGAANSLSAGWKYFKYSYTENRESYSLSNIKASKEFNENNILKYKIEQINFNSVPYKEDVFK